MSSQWFMYTPMPPTRTGVAHYASMLVPGLQAHINLEVVTGNGQPATDNRIYQLGNNLHHEWIYNEAMRNPGIVVLHDMVLHHLIVEMTLARGNAEGYIAALEANHGPMGAAWARGRAAGLHSEMGNFLLPASIDVANRSKAVIVHNRYALDRLQSLGVTTPIHVVPHPYEPQHLPKASRKFVAGLFGFLTSAKRSEVVLEALRQARAINRDVRLLVVGEPAPNIDAAAFAGDGIVFTGYVSDEEFANYFGEVDRIINLRYPSAGETSGTLIRAFDAGKPVAVSDYAQFAEYPDDCVTKIPLGDGEVEALTRFLTAELRDPGGAQRQWLEQNARIEQTVEGYLHAIEGIASRGTTHESRGTIPLFPELELVNVLTIRNIGDQTLKARQYGEPGYRLIVNGRWFDLPRDVAPGETFSIDLPEDLRGVPLTLAHAMQGIPIVEPEVWARVPIQ